MTKSAGQQLTAQQSRKVQEAFNVQRLTTWVGASALSLSGIFTAFAAKSAPVTIGVTPMASVEPQATIQNQVNGALDDRIVVRRVYLPPPPPVRPPTSGVRGAQAAGPAAAGGARPATAAATAVATTVVASAPAPAPAKPVAATGGSTPRH
jgi:hypothetical protein